MSRSVDVAEVAGAVSDAALWDLIQAVELVDLRTTRWYSELLDDQIRVVEDIKPELQVSFRSDDSGSIQCRWQLDTTLRDSAGTDVAEIGLTLIQVFGSTGHQMSNEITSDLLKSFVDRTAIISVMPFIREAVQTMTMRLGLQPITLGLMRAGAQGPSSFSVRGS